MDCDDLFESEENKALLAICTRKMIGKIGWGGILWGLLNTVNGYFALQDDDINIILLIIGISILFTGIFAVVKHTVTALLLESVTSFALVSWNIYVSFYNFKITGQYELNGVIFPLAVAITFFSNYFKLRKYSGYIRDVKSEDIKISEKITKDIIKAKPRKDQTILDTSNIRCRVKLMDDSAFFVHKDLSVAFVVDRESILQKLIDKNAKKYLLEILHPLKRFKYKFSKKNTEKLREWLTIDRHNNDAKEDHPAPDAEFAPSLESL